MIVQPRFWGTVREKWVADEKRLLGEWGLAHILQAPTSVAFICPLFNLQSSCEGGVTKICQSKVFQLFKIVCYHAYHSCFKTNFPKHPKLAIGRAMFAITHVTPKHMFFTIT